MSNKSLMGIEPWFAAHFAYGIVQMIFIPMLVPVFVLEMTDSASIVGIVMGIVGFSGLSAPILGGLADKFKAHRLVQLIGVLAYVLAALVFSVSGDTVALHIVAAVLLGVGSASLLMMNPAFVVAGGYSQEEEAVKLTRLNQLAIVGALVGGVLLGAVMNAGWSYEACFMLMAAISTAALVITALTNKEAADRVAAAGEQADEAQGEEEQSGGMAQLIFSRFGVFLAAVFFVTIGQGVITGQFPNYMKDVFEIAPSMSANALSVSAIASLIILTLAGNWMAKLGPNPVFIGALVASAGSMVALVLVAAGGPAVLAYIPLGLYIVYLQGVAVCDMSQPSIADKQSTAGAGLTQGLLMFSIAIAYAVGNVIGGFSADAFGFGSLAMVAGGTSAVAAVIAFMGLLGAKK